MAIVKIRAILGALMLLVSGQVGAAPIHVMFEADTDIASGVNELSIGTYGSFDDIVSNNFDSLEFTEKGVVTNYSTTGITFDGDDYHMLMEFDFDTAGFAELAIFSYASIDDIISSNSSLRITSVNVADGYSTTGIAFDGDDYHVMMESDAELTGSNSDKELAFRTYASFDDIVTDTPISSVFTAKGAFSGYSTTGITLDGDGYHIMFEADNELTGPAASRELAIATYLGFDDIISSQIESLVFTEKGVFSGYSTTGIVSAIPIPAAVWLFGTGLIGLIGFSKRRKAA